MKTYQIVLLPGDGVGPEVTAAARHVLEVVADAFGHEFKFARKLIGGAAIDETGDPLPPETLKACVEADAVFLGAVGGPKWDGGSGGRRRGCWACARRSACSPTCARWRSPPRPRTVPR